MKKSKLVFIAAFLTCAACGPSVHEKEAQRVADSTMMADSLAAVMSEQMRVVDSIAASENPELAKDISVHTNAPADKKLIKTADLKFQVGNVWRSTERIEDLTFKYEGYITYSNLQNHIWNSSSTNISRDSILVTREVIVDNEIRLRVPNSKVDSFIRELTPLVKYLDYRVIKMNDITFQLASIEQKNERFKKYEKRQSIHIDNKNSKLKDATSAEDNLLERQMQADEISLKAKELADQLKYCNMSINIYQKPIIVKEVRPDFKYVSSSKPNFFVRIIDSLVQGYWILEEILVFIFKLWGIILVGLAIYLIIKYSFKLTDRKQ